MHQLEDLAERLLREGVAYRHVRRYIGELRDHYDDLLRAEMAQGKSADAAEAAALARLGSVEHLACEMIARPELHAVSTRFPRLWGGAAPAVLWVVIVVATILAFAGLIKGFDAAGVPIGGSPRLASLQAPVNLFFFLVMRVLPVVIGSTMVFLAVRQRRAVAWSILGAMLLALIAGTTDTTVVFSLTPDVRSEMTVGSSLLPVFSAPFTDSLGVVHPDELRAGLLWFAVMAILALAPLLARRQSFQ